ncbi:MAG: hypothetical protein RI911_72 [Candidatus Parcubacteria bacterium]|jgi:hypothetical protein
MKSADTQKSENAVALITQMDSELYRDFRNASTHGVEYADAALFEKAFTKGREALRATMHEYVSIMRMGTPHAIVEVIEQIDTEEKARRFAFFHIAEAVKNDNPTDWEVHVKKLCALLKVSEKMTAELITRLTAMQ